MLKTRRKQLVEIEEPKIGASKLKVFEKIQVTKTPLLTHRKSSFNKLHCRVLVMDCH